MFHCTRVKIVVLFFVLIGVGSVGMLVFRHPAWVAVSVLSMFLWLGTMCYEREGTIISEKARSLRKRLQRHDLSTFATPVRIVLDHLARDKAPLNIGPDQAPFLERTLPPHPTPVMVSAENLVAIFREPHYHVDHFQVSRALSELEASMKLPYTT